jgi:hypothetical protein
MSILKNLLGNFMPHFEQRTVSGALAAVNAELVLDVNGDESATIYIDGGGATLNTTYVIEGSVNGTDYFSLLAFPLPQFCLGGTIPLAAQPMALEAVNAASLKRTVCVCVAQLKKVRVRLSVYAAGTATVTINADDRQSLSPYVRDQKSATLLVTATGAAGAAVTATIPSVAGLRHYIDFVQVIKFNAAALTAAAAPVLVTTTNIPGAPVLNFSAGAEAQGTDVLRELDFGGQGMAATALGTNTTVVAPATTGLLWRINVAYRLGL